MATLSNNSSGNFTTAATWSLVDPTTFTNSESNSTTTTVAFVGPVAGLTPGAITIDGILIKVAARNAVPSGTFSVRLFNVTGAAVVAGTTVTINVSDLPTTTPNGWVFMKFAAPVLLLAATAYRVEVTSSVSAQVTIYRDATTSNWAKGLRTVTTQAPAAADDLIITGEYVSAGSNSTYTVTMDNTTSATIFGSNVSPTAANGFGSGLNISGKGILNWGTTAATNYYLKLAGNITLYGNSTYQCGTSGTPIPATSTAKLEFACTSNVQFGFEARINSTVIMHGAICTCSAMLVANAAIGATTLTTDVSTGWLSGDVIALASTTRTATESEAKALTANAVGTTLTITALTNAHSGTLPTRAELINLNRNVEVFGTSTAFQSYINIADATIDIRYTEFFQLGSATANKRGIDFNPVLNTGSFRNCSFHDYIVASSIGINVSSATSNNWTIDMCNSYNTANTTVSIAATSGTNWTFSNFIGIRNVAGNMVSISDMGGTVNNITSTGSAGLGITCSDLTFTGAFSNLIAHSNNSSGVQFLNITALSPLTITSVTSWNNNSMGITVNNIFDITIDGGNVFGNLTANITSSAHYAACMWMNMVVNGGLPLACPIGYQTGADQSKIILDTCTFGATTPHSTGDFVGVSNTYGDITFRNCLLSSANKVVSNNIMVNGTEIKFAKFQQTVGNHITYKKFGSMQNDAVIFNFATPSSRMTPNSATNKMEGGTKKCAVPIGTTATISVYVRKSILGDGAAYNGTQPRLKLEADPAIGIMTDVILATGVSVNGVWEKLTGTTPVITDNAVFQFYIDCDGTAGWVNVDDWNVK